MAWKKPLKFSSPEELEEKIQEYFEECKRNKKIATMTGLAYHLNTDRSTLMRYKKCEEYGWLKRCTDEEKQAYSNSLKRATAYIESEYEQALFKKESCVGAIFTLKNNFGWKDKIEVNNTNRDITVKLVE